VQSTSTENLLTAFAHFFPNLKEVGSYINGEMVVGSGDTIQLFDPATGEKSLSYPDGGAEVVAQASAAAVRAQKEWWALTHVARGRVMFAIANEIRKEIEPLARLESIAAGKPIRDCRSSSTTAVGQTSSTAM
jgi:acyl-CoA reductase-like NAD-dependent aldehyde dehydrogenase